MPKTPTITLLTVFSNPGSALRRFIRVIEQQQVPYDRYQLVVVDQSSGDDSRRGLEELAEHRPNMVVVDGRHDASPCQSGLERATGDYVLPLSVQDRLMPRGLQTLLDHSADNTDVILARSTGPTPIGALPETMYRPWQDDAPDAPVAMLTPFALIRRQLLADALKDGAGWRAARIRVLSAAVSIKTVIDPPVAVGTGPATEQPLDAAWADADTAASELSDPAARARLIGAQATGTLQRAGDGVNADLAGKIAEITRRHAAGYDPEKLPPGQRDVTSALINDATRRGVATARRAVQEWSGLTVQPARSRASWSDGKLLLDLHVAVTTTSDSLAPGVIELEPTVVIRNVDSLATYRLPAEVTAPTATEPNRLEYPMSVVLDPRTTAGGWPLQRGTWELRIQLHGSGTGSLIGGSLPYAQAGAAVVDGEILQPVSEKGRLRLEVGAQTSGLLTRPRAEDAQITESAAGARLTIGLPDVAAFGDAVVGGKIFIDKFPLDATLHTTTGEARIECFISGMSGTSRLAARFGPAARTALGLQLRFNGSGDMAVEADQPKPAKAKKTQPTKPSAAKTTKPQHDQTPAGQPPTPRRAAGSNAAANPAPAAASKKADTSRFATVTRQLPRPIRGPVRRLYRKLVQ
jgi:hypothetical protein